MDPYLFSIVGKMAADLVDYLIAQEFVEEEEEVLEAGNVENEAVQLSLERKILRDKFNPFDISDSHFIHMYRLPKQAVHDLVAALHPHLRPCQRSTAIPQWMRVSKMTNIILKSPAGLFPRLRPPPLDARDSTSSVSLCLVMSTCQHSLATNLLLDLVHLFFRTFKILYCWCLTNV